MITYYLDADLVTGDNNGLSPANAWQSWAACKDYLNANHADLITAEQRIDVLVSGSETLGVSVLFAIDSNSTYFVKFVAATPDPGVWGGTAPQVAVQAPSSGNSTPDRAFRCDRAGASGGYYYEFEGINFYYPMMYSGSLTRGFFNQNVTRTAGTSFIIFRNCFVKFEPHTGTGAKYFFLRASGNSFQLYNCIFEGMRRESGAAIVALCNTTSSVSSVGQAAGPVVNCTFIDCGGFIRGHASADFGGVVANCLFVNSPAQIENFSGTFMREAVIGSNASTTLQTMQGNDNQTEVSVTFVSGTDRKLTAANDWGAGPKHGVYGASMFAEGISYVPATDVVGTARLGLVTDVGAHQFGTRTDDFDYTHATQPAVTYYLYPGLETGFGTGHTEADAVRGWDQIVGKINVAHPNLVASEQNVTIVLLGPVQPFNFTVTFTIGGNADYNLTLEAPDTLWSPGVFDLNAPGVSLSNPNVRLNFLPEEGSGKSVGFRLRKMQVTGPTERWIECTPQANGSYFLYEKNYVKDRENNSSSDGPTLLNMVTNLTTLVVSRNNIFQNFAAIGDKGGGLTANCQVYRLVGGTAPTFHGSNDTYIDFTGSNMSLQLNGPASFVNNLFLDAPMPFSSVTASTSGYNASTAGNDIPGVENIINIARENFIVGDGPLLYQSNGFGVGPANASSRAQYVHGFDLFGTERTGETTDVGAHLFVDPAIQTANLTLATHSANVSVIPAVITARTGAVSLTPRVATIVGDSLVEQAVWPDLVEVALTVHAAQVLAGLTVPESITPAGFKLWAETVTAKLNSL